MSTSSPPAREFDIGCRVKVIATGQLGEITARTTYKGAVTGYKVEWSMTLYRGCCGWFKPFEITAP